MLLTLLAVLTAAHTQADVLELKNGKTLTENSLAARPERSV